MLKDSRNVHKRSYIKDANISILLYEWFLIEITLNFDWVYGT